MVSRIRFRRGTHRNPPIARQVIQGKVLSGTEIKATAVKDSNLDNDALLSVFECRMILILLGFLLGNMTPNPTHRKIL